MQCYLPGQVGRTLRRCVNHPSGKFLHPIQWGFTPEALDLQNFWGPWAWTQQGPQCQATLWIEEQPAAGRKLSAGRYLATAAQGHSGACVRVRACVAGRGPVGHRQQLPRLFGVSSHRALVTMFTQNLYVNHIKSHRENVSWVDQEDRTFQIEKEGKQGCFHVPPSF